MSEKQKNTKLTDNPDVKIDIERFLKLKCIRSAEKKKLIPLLIPHFENHYRKIKTAYPLNWIINSFIYYFLITCTPTLISWAFGFSINFKFKNEISLLTSFFLLITLLLAWFAYRFFHSFAENKVEISFVFEHASSLYLLVFSISSATLVTLLSLIRLGMFPVLFLHFPYYILPPLMFIAATILSYGLGDYVTYFLFKGINQANPAYTQSSAITFLLWLLERLEKQSLEPYLTLNNKKAITSLLSVISIELSKLLVTPFENLSTDPYFEIWIKKNAQGITQSINKYRELVINSDKQTIPNLQKFAQRLFITLLTGEWGKLERLKQTEPAPISWKIKAGNAAKSVTVGILPFLAILVIDNLHPIAPSLSSYIYVAAVIWGVINLMMAIDPAIAERIKITKDVTDMIKSK